MKLLGATVVPVTSGSRTLKDALNEAMRDWVTNVDHTFFCLPPLLLFPSPPPSPPHPHHPHHNPPKPLPSPPPPPHL